MTTKRQMRIWLDKEKQRLIKRHADRNQNMQELQSLEGSILTINKVINYFDSINAKEQ